MEFLPLFHNLRGSRVLVVGGGEIALRKSRLIADAGAVLRVVAPEIEAQLSELVVQSGGEMILRGYSECDLDGCVLIIAATDDEPLNAQVSRDARLRCVPVNVVDAPALCTVIFPAIVDRSPLVIAVSSGGDAPVLARLIRAKLETWIPSSYGQLAGLAARFRNQVKGLFPNVQQRRAFWEDVFQGAIADRQLAGQGAEAERMLIAKIAGEPPSETGEVYLVGAGPGDPDLLTFRALRLMQQADVVLYDRLVAPTILDLCRRDAERVYVGKRRAEHAVPQEQINQQLVALAKQGKRVVRLKGGDPFIFGRGGEEIEELAAHGIPFQVVPGITAASGCAAYAGIPLTHRDHAQSVRFITGHLKNGTTDLPWSDLVAPAQTLVFYMGLIGLPVICEQLIRHGRSADTPAALVEQGTTVNQRVFTGTLANLPQLVAEHDVHAPTLVIIGEVVKLREKLAWFEGAQATL
ncbi:MULTISPECIES: siroheme synthase CysG [Pseudomonas]|jgi:uroporphyrin-III C-methyltransferase/precorrin-2 dehydrogenase/sirohydrochlorin ferrochelatase|uniref:Siroheme synthase n=6 Tax=Pseudomonas syringae group TaxID=136849 RepID=A0A6B2AYC9_PSESX|nr:MULTISPECIES: siroheme synthase CysG [Pseudomonas]AKF50929.1 uroporphyrinogen-III C-methyltransferase /precorrin-2 dehydrogenase [Pseudomonas syringae pv. syringae HS191]ELP97021.1 uroporphyrin-III C-methyltransferase [Pseudomonas syringae BRIP34876]ELP97291.1 uroporphyrin-III C-methyltransferase [Pseudomonas syringae BRIP34881]EPF67222.1 Siroheme synthase / Uroporphyrinogen-III methyltransferase [Pseudomonas syringae pv. syringae SM]KFF82640.1 sirohydrochlorin ferrochelatase [Pseudomonas s